MCRICEERVRPASALAAHTTACAAVEAAVNGGSSLLSLLENDGTPGAALARLAELARCWAGSEGAACVPVGDSAAARAGVAAAAAAASAALSGFEAAPAAADAADTASLDAAIAALRAAAAASPPCSVAEALGRRALRLARAARRAGGGRAPTPTPGPPSPAPAPPVAAAATLPPPSPGPPSAAGVSIADFEVLKPISRGAYGRVYLARKRATGDLYAVKVMRKADLVRKNAVAGVVTERDILAASNNPFVVRFYWAFTSPTAVYLVMEYAAGGDLASLLAGVGALEEGCARPYIAEAVLALAYCHARGVVHRDVKPDNLLIAGDGHVKLADFGLSTVGVVDRAAGLDGGGGGGRRGGPGNGGAAPTPTRRASGGAAAAAAPPPSCARRAPLSATTQPPCTPPLPRAVGTPDYLAPELLLGGAASAAHGPAVDWWALGAVLFECVAGVPPFASDAPEGVFANILARAIHWPLAGEEDGGRRRRGSSEGGAGGCGGGCGGGSSPDIALSPACVDLVDRLLDPDPATRLGAGPGGAADVRAHPWFAGVDWAALAASKAALAPPFIPALAGETDTCYFAPRSGVSSRSMAFDAAGGAGGPGGGVPGVPPPTPWSVMRGGPSPQPPHAAPPAWVGERAEEEEGEGDGGAAATTPPPPPSPQLPPPPASRGAGPETAAATAGLPPQLTRTTSTSAASAGAAFSQGEAFLNFSFKNVASLGAANADVAGALAALRAEFGGGVGEGGDGRAASGASDCEGSSSNSSSSSDTG